jgi:hypothetical protein
VASLEVLLADIRAECLDGHNGALRPVLERLHDLGEIVRLMLIRLTPQK